MRQIKLYDNIDWEECIRVTGRPHFRVKGEGHRDDLFAAMPPLEAKKLLFKMAAATWKGKSEGKEPDKIMLIDVKKAHLNGVVGADVWACIELGQVREASQVAVRHAAGSESMGGRLPRSWRASGFCGGRPLRRCSTIRGGKCVLSCTVTTSR